MVKQPLNIIIIFTTVTTNFYHYLIARGHQPSDLDPLFQEVSKYLDTKQPPISTLSTARPKPINKVNQNQIILHWEFHPNDISRRQIRTAYNTTLAPHLQEYPIRASKFTIAYSNPCNLRRALTKTQLEEAPESNVSRLADQMSPEPPQQPPHPL